MFVKRLRDPREPGAIVRTAQSTSPWHARDRGAGTTSNLPGAAHR